MDIDKLIYKFERNYPGEVQFQQVLREFLESVDDIVNRDGRIEEQGIIERLIEPDRIFVFKVPWIDDQGKVQVNKGYRIQFNNALGPYKGGLRFHPNIGIGELKFLAFEQVMNNALSSLMYGGAKGGADFDPKGKSENEIMKFCQAFMLELYRIIGRDIDIPAGEMGVGPREVGYLSGMYKKLSGESYYPLTGKSTDLGGIKLRVQAAGYGLVYFVDEMLKTKNQSLEGKKIAISGFGNVAWGAAKKASEMGAKVITISGPDGYIYAEDGLTSDMINFMPELRASHEDIVKPMSYEFSNLFFKQKKKPWEVKCDVALPCAIENELTISDADMLISNNCICVAEGATRPCTPDAVESFIENGILFGPGKAANGGGTILSGLEILQNTTYTKWSDQEVELKLKEVIKNIHNECVISGTNSSGKVNYVDGANITAFMKVANAMLDLGVI